MRQIIRAAVFSALALPSLVFAKPAHAQSPAGAWEGSISARLPNEFGEETLSPPAPLAIRIDQKGDSLFVSFKRGAAESWRAGEEIKFKGVLKDGAIALAPVPTEGRLVSGDGQETVMTTMTTLAMKVQNDELAGTVTFAPEDESIPRMMQEFKATRKK